MSVDQLFYSAAGALAQAGLSRTKLANARLRLFKQGITPSWQTTLAELQAEQCDFDGYTAGGIDTGTWSAPTYGPGQSAVINAGLVTFVCTAGPGGNGNVVGGFYLVTTDDILWLVGQFADGFPMQVAGQGLPVALALAFGTG